MTPSSIDFSRDGAVAEGEFRYLLWRNWGFERWMLFVMLNPSTADASVDDPTIRKCKEFARRRNRNLVVANLYAYRATDPRNLKAAGYPVGPDNDYWLRLALETLNPRVVVAWGAGRAITGEIAGALTGRDLWCLGRTKSGNPRHPLFLSYATTLEKWP